MRRKKGSENRKNTSKKKKKRDEMQRKCLVNYVELKIRTMRNVSIEDQKSLFLRLIQNTGRQVRITGEEEMELVETESMKKGFIVMDKIFQTGINLSELRKS